MALAGAALVLCLASGCATPSRQAAAPLSPPVAALSCPSGDFRSFLDTYAESEPLQRAFTRFPLPVRMLDTAGASEPTPVERTLDRQQASFPLMPSKLARARQGLELRVEELSERRARVRIAKPDTDFQTVYVFGKEGCWRLERLEDASL